VLPALRAGIPNWPLPRKGSTIVELRAKTITLSFNLPPPKPSPQKIAQGFAQGAFPVFGGSCQAAVIRSLPAMSKCGCLCWSVLLAPHTYGFGPLALNPTWLKRTQWVALPLVVNPFSRRWRSMRCLAALLHYVQREACDSRSTPACLDLP